MTVAIDKYIQFEDALIMRMPTYQPTLRESYPERHGGRSRFIARVTPFTRSARDLMYREWALARRDGAYGMAARAEPAISP